MYDGVKAFEVIDDEHSSHNVDCDKQYSPVDTHIQQIVRQASPSDMVAKKDM